MKLREEEPEKGKLKFSLVVYSHGMLETSHNFSSLKFPLCDGKNSD